MKPLFRSFGIFIRQILRDDMLWAICFAPVLAALFFKYGIPYIEDLWYRHLGQQSVLSGYYLLFDMILGILTSFMFCYASAMVMLTERDENMARYMAVTPVGKKGYTLSRLILPGAISVPFSVLLMLFFSLTNWNVPVLFVACTLMSLLSMSVALLIFSLSRNKVEGLAMGKLSSLMFVGFAAPFFIFSNRQYLVSFLPSFWVAKYCIDRNIQMLLSAFVVSILWLWPLYRRFERKLY